MTASCLVLFILSCLLLPPSPAAAAAAAALLAPVVSLCYLHYYCVKGLPIWVCLSIMSMDIRRLLSELYVLV